MSMCAKFDKGKFIDEISLLSHFHKVLVGVSACERLIRFYDLFNRETSYGNCELLKTTLSKIWQALENNDLSSINAAKLAERCEEQAPDSEDFGDMLGTFSQNSVFSLCSLLDYLDDGRDERIAQAVSFVVDTVDFLAQEVELLDYKDTELETKILVSDVMQRELSNQKMELEQLSSSASFNELFLSFRKKSTELGIFYLKLTEQVLVDSQTEND